MSESVARLPGEERLVSRDHLNGIPVLTARGNSIAVAWENSLLELWNHGCHIENQYEENYEKGHALSVDATMTIVIEDPMSEPALHRCFPAGLSDLEEYRMEFVEGIKDHWVKHPDDPDYSGEWTYTYSQRFKKYDRSYCDRSDMAWGRDVCQEHLGKNDIAPINQVQFAIDALAKSPHSRRVKLVTWQPWIDLYTSDPPCFCTGTRIATPIGQVNIEDLHAGDSVYAYDLKSGCLVVTVAKSPFSKIESCVGLRTVLGELKVSRDQLVRSGEGWKHAKDLEAKDVLRMSLADSAMTVTDAMVFGYLCGDGWLSSGYNRSRPKPLKRYDVCFSVHPEADDSWVHRYLSANSKNRVNVDERQVDSALVQGHISKTVRVHDKALWMAFTKMGCPSGKKVAGVFFDNSEVLSWGHEQLVDFVTGVLSAEGSIRYDHGSPGVRVAMCWPEFIEVFAEVLDRLGVKYTRHDDGYIFTVSIGRTEQTLKLFSMCDFRLDSRKQSQYIEVMEGLRVAVIERERRMQLVGSFREARNNGATLRELSGISGFNQRVLDPEYTPRLRYHKVELNRSARWIDVPIVESVDLGNRVVHDFEVDHPDHAIVANGIVAHNCLGEFWLRCSTQRGFGGYVLNGNVIFRSRDAYDAAFMNLWGEVAFLVYVAGQLQLKLGKPVRVGRLVDMSHSYHLYGKRIPDFKEEFLGQYDKRTLEDRTWTRAMAQPLFDEARPGILAKIRKYDAQKR